VTLEFDAPMIVVTYEMNTGTLHRQRVSTATRRTRRRGVRRAGSGRRRWAWTAELIEERFEASVGSPVL
jgi:hypothetical protein